MSCSAGVDTARRDAEPGAERDEIEVWIPQLELRLGSRTGLLDADARELRIEDRVGAVVEDHDGDVELFARHRPERLDRVQSRAVGLECDDRAVRTRDRCAHRDRQPLADRATGQGEPVMPGSPRGTGRQSER